MRLHRFYTYFFLVILLVFVGCSSKKSGKQSKLNRFYHNTTGYYNGYWNAQQLINSAEKTLASSHEDDYNELLPVFPYENSLDKSLVSADMNKAMTKVAKVNYIHERSRWLDDGYVLMGKAQLLKNDLDSAEITLAYFEEAFDPDNPDGRLYKSAKNDKEQRRKEREKARAEKRKKAEADSKERKEERKKAIEKREAEAEQKAKTSRQEGIKKRAAQIKAKEEKQKRRKKRRKKGSKKRRKKTKSELKPEKRDIPKKVEEKSIPVKEEKPKEEKKEEESEEETFEGIKEEKVNPVYNRGRYLLAETYARKEKYSDARYLLSTIYQEKDHDKFVKRNVPVLRAYLDLKEEQYDDAIENLTEAIEVGKSRSLKARYAYILGQLYARKNNFTKAAEQFAQSKKWAKSFEMEFNADLNAKKNALASGTESRDKVIKKLKKMSKMDKYEEEQSTIYSTLAEIYAREGNLKKAKEYLVLASRSKSSNQNLKKTAYLNLANIYYDNHDYVNAKLYLDSTLMVMDRNAKNYEDIQRRRDGLSEVSQYINKIALNDSLLNMTKLSDVELMDLAKANINAENEASKKLDKIIENKPFVSSFEKMTFPFYNRNSRDQGKISFDSKWKNRPLTDMWRVKTIQENRSRIEQTEDKSNNPVDAELARIKSQIPYKSEQQEKLKAELEETYVNLGKVLKLNLDEPEQSNEVLETFLGKYKESDYRPDAYYYAYLNYTTLGNQAQANKYLTMLTTQYPDHEYAKYASDKGYRTAMLDSIKSVDKLYEMSYKAYTNGEYAKVKDYVEVSNKEYANNPLALKFELLGIMAEGSSLGRVKYVKALQTFADKNEITPEGIKARELITILTGNPVTFNKPSTKSPTSTVNYEIKDDAMHYVIIATQGLSNDVIQDLKVAISNYNKTTRKYKRLKISDSVLNDDQKESVILIRNFKNAETSSVYLKNIKAEESIFSKAMRGEGYAISKFNYRRLLKSKDIRTYHNFYGANYEE